MVRATYWATKLLPYARCRRSAKCPGPVLLVTSRPLSRRRLLLRPLLAIRILCAVLRILPAVGLVRHRPSLVVVIAVPCFGPPANATDSPRFGRESALQVSSAFNTTTQSHKTSLQVIHRTALKIRRLRKWLRCFVVTHSIPHRIAANVHREDDVMNEQRA